MQSRTSYSLVTSLLLTVACAYQNAGAGTDNQGGDPDTNEGGSSAAGTTTKAGSSSLPLAGSANTGSAGKSAGTGGKSAGTGGKASSGGKGGKAGAGGADAGAAGEDTGPVNMPIVGLSVTFKADSTSDPVDFLGGELHLINDTAQPLSLADLKIRYYFSNEVTGVTPAVTMNWAQFGPTNNLGGATCTGTLSAAAKPVLGADSYIELSCTGANGSELTAGTMLKLSWKAGAQVRTKSSSKRATGPSPIRRKSSCSTAAPSSGASTPPELSYAQRVSATRFLGSLVRWLGPVTCVACAGTAGSAAGPPATTPPPAALTLHPTPSATIEPLRVELRGKLLNVAGVAARPPRPTGV